MHVRYAEGWLAAVLAAQPWVRQVVRWSTDGGPKPVGLTLNGSVRIQLVRGSPTTPSIVEQPTEWTGEPVAPVAVEAAPRSPQDWADAVARAAAATGHDVLKLAETYGQWGQSIKPAGVHLVFTDGAEVYGSLLDGGR